MTNKNHDPMPVTISDAVRAWDNDEIVFTVEMGGIGPGYEMSIQGLVFEFLREFDGKIPLLGSEISDDEIVAINVEMDAIVRRLNDKPWARFTGAQVGAAKSLVFCIIRRGGYRAALKEEAVKDRLILVCRKDLRTKP